MQYNPEELNDLLNIYKIESEEIIQELNENFLELEKNPSDKAPLKRLFQLAHSLKGSSRMLGFKSVQDLAHKLEDVLSYWEKNNITIYTDAFQIIYKLCDFFTEIIEKSIEQQSNYENSNVNIMMRQLDNFINTDKLIAVENEAEKEARIKEEVSDNYLVKHNDDVEALILELMFIIEKENLDDNSNEAILVIIENLKQLADIFHKTNYVNIRQTLSLLLAESLSYKTRKPDFNVLKQNFIGLKTQIYNVYKTLNINTTEEKNLTKNSIKPVETAITEVDTETNIQNEETISKFNDILQNFQKIKSDLNYIQIINELLKKLIDEINSPNISILFNKIINLLGKYKQNNVKVDNDCYTVVLQCVYIAKKIYLNEQDETNNNFDLLIQRLDLIDEIFKISNTQPSEVVNLKGTEISLAQIQNVNKDFKTIDLQEIKTLRVDTAKLDSLITQTSELLINGIKTKEHIDALSEINLKLAKWHNVSKKITNYLKYIEKKGVFNFKHLDNTNTFFKRTQDFFYNNEALVSEINNDFVNLYNMISEDDNKLHQTAIEIESIAKKIRVLPLATLFHSFPRMIRDIAEEDNKKINFIISGSDTTVDKKIIEEVKMPLIHILRNSVSHGIESPEERIKNGKNEVGTIRLSAKQIENNIIITVEDDGYGVNIDKVKAIALKKELLSIEEIEAMNNEQLMNLLFIPGFSTEESVNEISGRGVGLDIVKTKIANLSGEISIDSVLNKGCRVTIKLPLLMSAIKAFILLINKQKYIIPVNCIKYVKKISQKDIYKKDGINCILYDEHSVPAYFLSEILGETAETSDYMNVLIMENQEKQVAFLVNDILGNQEVFRKKMILPIIKLKNISGFTTLSTGEICLIINPYELIKNTLYSTNMISDTVDSNKEP